jgi:hypothetical protein
MWRASARHAAAIQGLPLSAKNPDAPALTRRFYNVTPDPTLTCIREGLREMEVRCLPACLPACFLGWAWRPALQRWLPLATRLAAPCCYGGCCPLPCCPLPCRPLPSCPLPGCPLPHLVAQRQSVLARTGIQEWEAAWVPAGSMPEGTSPGMALQALHPVRVPAASLPPIFQPESHHRGRFCFLIISSF